MSFRFWVNCGLVFLIAALSIPQLSFASEIKPGNNQPMPNIRWQDADEKTHQLKDSDGQPRLLHFWAAWCFPCRTELPDMLAWQEKNSDLLIIPLSLDERMAQSKYFIKKYKLNMPPLLMNKEDSEKLDIPALPFTIFVSADGTYSGNYLGIAPWHDDAFTAEIHQHFKAE